ncbi:MAG: hypothetical protein KKD01_00445 [Proteobacteria bacterium]|nr:hypothetical protein [Pseudomonadota bacterium]MBU1231348.1 hypothetical protein [Pseudomonadota bacterium]MBU1417818.1 hypothetical protein [Pseudomonadota bacterium]MBU1453166.1 hypothetical protein [Pseudomonadota bacterium]
MTEYLSSSHFPCSSTAEADNLAADLAQLLENDFSGDLYGLLAGYQRILADNKRRAEWPDVHNKLEILFKCGRYQAIDGPMIGIPVSIRDSDYFQDTVQQAGQERSMIAGIEWMATAWNMTFADTGLWMGKTFEPVRREVVVAKTNNNLKLLEKYDTATTRIGRNFFREPSDPDLIQGLGLPVLTPLWNLQPRPTFGQKTIFDADLLEENMLREKNIPYTMTGGIFLASFGQSVVPEMHGKTVYQLNYRWPLLNPVFPMTRLIDELVQIGEGIYLGQLVFATRHYSIGDLPLPFIKNGTATLGEPYTAADAVYYGYQNNGYFLMMAPDRAEQVYADTAFPQLRPRAGECGYAELGYDKLSAATSHTKPGKPAKQWHDVKDWRSGWQDNSELRAKFTTFILEDSPKSSDTEDVKEMRREDESILQMLQRISQEISAESKKDDRLSHFDKLHRLFRCGVAPKVENGLFKGHGKRGYNCRVDGQEERDWYGQADVARGWDYYHGANLNLHLGLADTFSPASDRIFDDSLLFPAAVAESLLSKGEIRPNVLDIIWRSIGKYIFPWAGKSFETISGRKLSMLLDESSDLKARYPERVRELKSHLASRPHYELVKKAAKGYWQQPGLYADHLQHGSWDKGMLDADKAFWEEEARNHWVDGCNIQDHRILMADPLFRVIDMNYRTPDPALQAVSEAGPSPFARQGYIFLGVSERESILPINNSPEKKKKVFQFHYRSPMVGGPAPIGLCLDELVEIADGLFLGQLIYSTALTVPYHSSIDPAQYSYQLFGYFLLLDDAWQYHRKAIKLDTWQE